jgi:hypothetical protein
MWVVSPKDDSVELEGDASNEYAKTEGDAEFSQD